MSKHRRAAKIDSNQPAIVKALRKINGVTVELNHDDILVGYKGITYWFEIKNINGKNRKQESQIKLEKEWKGHYRIVSNIDEILFDIGLLTSTRKP